MIAEKTNEDYGWYERNNIHITLINKLNGVVFNDFKQIRLGDLLYSEIWYMLNKSRDQIAEDIEILLNKRCFLTEYKKGKNNGLLLLSY